MFFCISLLVCAESRHETISALAIWNKAATGGVSNFVLLPAHSMARIGGRYEKRVHEYDMCTNGPERKPEDVAAIVLSTVKAGEARIAELRPLAETAAIAYQDAKAELRQHELALRRASQESGDPGDDAVEVGAGDAAGPTWERITIREFDDVLFRDVGGKLRARPSWPLILDRSKQVSTFLRYRDTNYINACLWTELEPDVLRRALLGAIRYGKPLVLDFKEADLFEVVGAAFDAIEPGLFDQILSKEIISPRCYERLIRKDADGVEYDPVRFTETRINNFWVYFITEAHTPHDETLSRLLPLEVMPGGPG